MKTFTYYRPPTPSEIKFGDGAMHYAEFTAFVCMKANGEFKKWLKSPFDGLRYYR